MKNNLRKNTGRERAWKLMRAMRMYTLADIATLAESDCENIRHYHQCLVRAGYARQVGTRRQEGRPGLDKVYRLVKKTGPKPPVQKALRFIFDPNSGEYWSEDPAQVAEVTAAEAKKAAQRKEPASKPNAVTKVRVKPGSPLDLAEKKRGRRRVG